MNRQELTEQIFLKGSYLCVGLDTDPQKLPPHLQSDPDAVYNFNRAIIDATKDHCVAYKINTAFYEAMGAAGWEIMQRTAEYIPATHFKIADAKRGDIGNTSSQYARAFFETMNFDAITVAPYMGEDSIRPFLEYENKWTILLGLTSNAGAKDFELQNISDGRENKKLYETVMEKSASWGTTENLMFVIGATRADQFQQVRTISPNHFFLVPGIGAQGGSLSDISSAALIEDCGILVNASRAVIYASSGADFAEMAGSMVSGYQKEMKIFLSLKKPSS